MLHYILHMAKIYFYDVNNSDEERFKKALDGNECIFYQEPLSAANFHTDAEIISIFVSSKLPAPLIDKMPLLKLIACRSAGFNNVDTAKAKERNIPVVTVPTYGEHTVAEYSFALLLSLTRMVPETIKSVKESVCIEPHLIRGIDLNKKILGVIGTGKIGKRVIEIAKGFGMTVVAHDPYEDKEASVTLGFQYVSLETLCKEADIITLHSPLTKENHHLLSNELFEVMKKGVYIVNTARGELIDTKALIVALDTNKVAACALDVVEGEELLNERCKITDVAHREPQQLLEESFFINSLLSHPRVILTPHIAYNTLEAVERINTTTTENILSYLQGTTINEVHPGGTTMGRLLLVRHTESEWNEKGIWTGTRDAKLSMKGFEDARLLGEAIRTITIHHAYTSLQTRTMETLSSMLGTMQQPVVPITRDKSLNERDYGDYTGKNKHEMKDVLGEELFDKTRRGWDVAIPNGETLRNVYERIVPYYLSEILPRLKLGENVLVVSHGNALRALIKYIENISDEDIENVEMMFGGVLIYGISDTGRSFYKEVKKTPSVYFDTHF